MLLLILEFIEHIIYASDFERRIITVVCNHPNLSYNNIELSSNSYYDGVMLDGQQWMLVCSFHTGTQHGSACAILKIKSTLRSMFSDVVSLLSLQ